MKLQDRAAGFDNIEQPKPFISTFVAFREPKAAMGQAFRNLVFNLTIDVDTGNPGAVALHYINNNQGTVHLGGSYRPQVRDQQTNELFLHIDFTEWVAT